MGIQLDFGGFDPIFPGISISFSRAEAWKTFDAYTTSGSPLPLPNSVEERFELLSIISVLAHEIRHFHDSLLSPYAIRVFRLRFHTLLSIVQLLPDLVKDGPNCVGVPISTWCALNQEERDRYLERLPKAEGNKCWLPVSLPNISTNAPLEISGSAPHSAEAVAAVITAATARRNQISELANRPTRDGPYSVQPWQIFELSALLTQIEEINATYGVDEVNFFLKQLQSMAPNPYAEILEITNAVWTKLGLPMATYETNALAVWSMCGSYKRDQWKACPAERYMRLLNYFLENGIGDEDSDSWFEVFDRWSNALDLSTVEEGFEDSRSNLDLLFQFAEQTMAATKLNATLEPALEALKRITDAHLYTVKYFQENPDNYISPHRYLNSPVLPDPVLRTVFPGGGLYIPKTEAELEQDERYLHWGTAEGQGIRAFSISFPLKLSHLQYLTPEQAFDVFDLFALVDFVFAESGRARDDIQRSGREFFKQRQLIPFEVF